MRIDELLGGAEALAPAIRAEVAKLDPEVPMVEVRTMQRGIYQSFTGLRYGVWVIAFFAALAAVKNKVLTRSLSLSGVINQPAGVSPRFRG